MRAIRRSDLDETRATLPHDVGDSEAAADLDELAARNDRVAPVGERVEHEHERGGAVVHDQGVFGASQLPQ